VGWLHRFPYHPYQVVAQCVEVRVVPERRREGLEGLPRAGRAVVIISGMCKKGALDRRREDSGCLVFGLSWTVDRADNYFFNRLVYSANFALTAF
jgi:hypothetical protein